MAATAGRASAQSFAKSSGASFARQTIAAALTTNATAPVCSTARTGMAEAPAIVP